MLQTMRNPKVLKGGLWIVLILIIPSFVAFYGFSESGGGSDGGGQQQIYATVTTPKGKTRDITQDEMKFARAEMLADYQRLYGRLTGQGFSEAMKSAMQRSVSNREWADYAVSEAALDALAEEYNIIVTNEQVAESLRKSGTTSKELDDYLRFKRMSEAQFLAEQRAGMRDERSEELVRSIAKVSMLELWLDYRLQNEKAQIVYANIPSIHFRDQIEVTDADIQEYFTERQNEYTKREERVYRYVMVPAPPAKAPEPPTEEELRALYEEIDPARDSRFAEEPGTRVRQIVLEVNDEETSDSVIQQMQDIRAEATEENFDQLANQHSEDMGNLQFAENRVSQRGGLLSKQVNETTQADFIQSYGQKWYDTINALQPGQVSEPFESNGRFFIAKVEGISTGKLPFEEARPILEARIRSQRREAEQKERNEYIAKTQQEMREIAETRTRIEAIADVLGQQVQETSPTLSSTNYIVGVGDLSASAETLREMQEGDISPVLRASGTDNVVVLKLEKILPQRPQTLDEVRPDVERMVRLQKAGVLSRAAADELAERVRSGDNLTSAAAELNFEVQSTDEFTISAPPSNLQFAEGLPEFVFRSQPGEVGVVRSGMGISDYLVVQIVGKTEPGKMDFVRDLKQLELVIQEGKRESMLMEFRRDAVKNLKPQYNEDFVSEDQQRSRRRRREAQNQ